MTEYRDSSEKLLTDYPRPSLAVDTAVLTVKDGALCVALVQNKEGWRLPGTFAHERETLSDAVLRSLHDKAHIMGLRPRQLHVFDAPNRDTRGWVISVAHLVAVPHASISHVELKPVSQVGHLIYDHNLILELAVHTLRDSYRASPDPERLLDPEFTLLELLRLHSAIAGEPLGKDTFRRRVLGELVETDAYKPGLVGKPAKLFRHAEL
ncbi:NUDIX hydrolase [Cryobacterium sp. TMT1-66-1]|uniref:NUDIX hydrolase n=1 Tax=Cryobacterium sp. TMT1-66-1 TaxID=1259242 RepID=UPI001069EF48|nr:NUDIX hydrolase [Cryobacterium sp. TMT1-66-1]TFD05526.1 NUDIX domain-containing protein [Cryobacterium sp. TMT1-66-1]